MRGSSWWGLPAVPVAHADLADSAVLATTPPPAATMPSSFRRFQRPGGVSRWLMTVRYAPLPRKRGTPNTTEATIEAAVSSRQASPMSMWVAFSGLSGSMMRAAT